MTPETVRTDNPIAHASRVRRPEVLVAGPCFAVIVFDGLMDAGVGTAGNFYAFAVPAAVATVLVPLLPGRERAALKRAGAARSKRETNN